MTPPRRIIILGSTGSIGVQTLEVVASLNREGPRVEVVGLACGRDAATLSAQASRLGSPALAVADPAGPAPAGALIGPGSAEALVRTTPCDLVVSAIVGEAGLGATLAALELGRDVALANKESLVAAGELVTRAALASGAALWPIDSEHSGVWHCLGAGTCRPPLREPPAGVTRVVLTASGGPFRGWDPGRIRAATPGDALNHPTWRMGAKVTVDSASLMNKALEIIEAHWLFALPADRLAAVVHPQSIVHALVERADGSILAHLAPPDMKVAIRAALEAALGDGPAPTHPPAAGLDSLTLGRLEFEPPDRDRFPAIALGHEVLRLGGTAGAVLNAANEEAVHAFLTPGSGGPGIAFPDIAALASAALRGVGVSPVRSLADVREAGGEARRFVRARLGLG
ncbi:MAG: 1-deoxy-D-xylulose-5-phosphate reductoisomerase [Phycisphaeraceae bacterium]|nr:MAG: 1-deoxy-D-xylulose-5-phosphate reductoisomerase [Phycisphaeraceae bacterium]